MFNLRFFPQRWDSNDNAVDAGEAFTFEVTTKYEALKATGELGEDENMSSWEWIDMFEKWYFEAVEAGQIDEVWDGPFDIEAYPYSDAPDFPEVGGARVAKTTITLTVLHPVDEPIANLADALARLGQETVAGQESAPRTVRVLDENVQAALAGVNAAPNFFDNLLARP